MRGDVPSFHMQAPQSLEEALKLLKNEAGQWQPFAGGTDLMVLFEAGKLPQKKYMSLHLLNELRGITTLSETMTLGALTTFSHIRQHPVLQEEFPLLVQAAREVGGPAIQNRATIGGNIANASPAADSPPALLAYDAQIELVSRSGTRWVAYKDFHQGYKKMDLRPDELLRAVRLKRTTAGGRHYFKKVGPRQAQAISKICFAGILFFEGEKISEIRIGIGSVAAQPLRCMRTEKILRGEKLSRAVVDKAVSTFSQEISPIDDIRSTAVYRRRVSENLLRHFLMQESRYVGLDR